MTPRGSSGRSGRARGEPPEPPSSPGPPGTPGPAGRRLAAAAVAAVAGAIAFAALLALGLLLAQRLGGSSSLVLGVIVVLFAAAGLYAGWLAAMIVFSAVRGEADGA
jgi:fatty acid desaturase